MSSQKILLAARSCFARDGYEGASLQKIAEEVGIKKPSIYAHYKGKEDLFLHVMTLVFFNSKTANHRLFHPKSSGAAGKPDEELFLTGCFRSMK